MRAILRLLVKICLMQMGSSISNQGDLECDKGWKPFNGICYKSIYWAAYSNFKYPKSNYWISANNRCQQEHERASLLSELSYDDTVSLIQIVAKYDMRDQMQFFVGITMGNKYPAPITNDSVVLQWPKCTEPPDITPGECGILVYDAFQNTFCMKYRQCEGQTDFFLHVPYHYLCSYKPSSVRCDPGWRLGPDGETCFLFKNVDHKSRNSWYNVLCSSLLGRAGKQSATLAIAKSLADMMWLKTNVANITANGFGAYIGLVKNMDDTYQWLDGSQKKPYVKVEGTSCSNCDCGSIFAYSEDKPTYPFQNAIQRVDCDVKGDEAYVLSAKPEVATISQSSDCESVRTCTQSQHNMGSPKISPFDCSLKCIHTCSSWYNSNVHPQRTSKVLPLMVEIYGKPKLIKAYCDMETDGGGWTVLQRRVDGSVNFSRTWEDYKVGFGDLNSEHWLGNDNIYYLTNCVNNVNELRVEVSSCQRDKYFMQYQKFQLLNDTGSEYRLSVDCTETDTYGNLFDAICEDAEGGSQNGMEFSTIDRDHGVGGYNCGHDYGGGWWFNHCGNSNLNGKYYGAGCTEKAWNCCKFMPHNGVNDGIFWYTYEYPSFYSYKSAEMKIRSGNYN